MSVVIEKHPAVVTSVDDPDKKFRIKVKCAAIMGDEDAELPQWVKPKQDWGWVLLPEVNDQVEIEITTSAPVDEALGQAAIQDPDVRWSGSSFLPVPDEFKAAYGKQRGFFTAAGHFLIFNDDDGSLTVLLANGASLKLEGKDSGAKMTVGDGAVGVAIANALKDFWNNQVKPKFDASDAHQHIYNYISPSIPSATVPTIPAPGTPSPAVGLPGYASAITSTKVTIPNG